MSRRDARRWPKEAGADPGGVHALTRAIARGDELALAAFYEAWFDECYTLARRLTGRDESFCLDVVQDAMLRVIRSMRPMRTQRDLSRWMARVVHTAALDRMRDERRRAARERRSAAGGAATGPDERVEWIAAQLAALPETDRALLGLRFGRSRTLAQAAEATRMTEGAAHGRIRRAIERMRKSAWTKGDSP